MHTHSLSFTVIDRKTSKILKSRFGSYLRLNIWKRVCVGKVSLKLAFISLYFFPVESVVRTKQKMKNTLRTGGRRKFKNLVKNLKSLGFESSHATLLPQSIVCLEVPRGLFFPTREIKKCNRNKLQSLGTLKPDCSFQGRCVRDY